MSEEILIAKDREGKELRFCGIENWNKMFKKFKGGMARHNHAAILSDNVNEEPTVPIAALARLAGTGGGPPLPTDARDKSDYLKVMRTWNNSCIIVLCSLLAMLNDDIKSAVKASGLDVEISTKANIQLIIDWIDVEYGGWNDLRGTRNYDEMKRIPNFTCIESTNAG